MKINKIAQNNLTIKNSKNINKNIFKKTSNTNCQPLKNLENPDNKKYNEYI